MPSKGFFSKVPQQRPRDFHEAWSQLNRHLDFLDLESHVDLDREAPGTGPANLLTSSVTTLIGCRGNNCQVKEWVFP